VGPSIVTTSLNQAYRLLVAATASAFGDGIRTTLLPVIANSTGGVGAAGIVLAAGYLPWLFFGLIAGAVADHVDKARVMVLLDFARATAVALFALAALGGTPPLLAVAGLAFALGTAETLFDNAAVALLPLVTPAEELPRINSRLYTAQTLCASLAGPAVGALLYGVMGSGALIVDAATFLLSAILVRSTAARRAPDPQDATAWSGIRAEVTTGMRWLAQHSGMRNLALLYALLGAVSGALLAILPQYAVVNIHLAAGGYGFVLTFFGVGTFAGGLLSSRLLGRRAAGELLAACAALAVLAFVLTGAAEEAVVAFVAMSVLGVAVAVWTVTTISLQQKLVPQHLLGRVAAALRVSGLLTTVGGSLLAGPLVSWVGISRTLYGCAVLITLFTLPLLRPVLGLRLQPSA